MLSSIGASAVLLILFFLLSSIAWLTSRKFGNGGHNFIGKHPIMFYSHCILFVLFINGGVIELIKHEVVPEKSWLWGLIEGQYYVSSIEITGRELLLRYCKKPAILGDIELIERCMIQSNCIAAENCEFLFIPLHTYKKYYSMMPILHSSF